MQRNFLTQNSKHCDPSPRNVFRKFCKKKNESHVLSATNDRFPALADLCTFLKNRKTLQTFFFLLWESFWLVTGHDKSSSDLTSLFRRYGIYFFPWFHDFWAKANCKINRNPASIFFSWIIIFNLSSTFKVTCPNSQWLLTLV